jgi:hypothetical protein
VFIEGDSYLRGRKGNYVERNADRLKWSHVVDLKLAHEFSINVIKKSHKIELTADVFNFTNLLNKNWGKRYFASFNKFSYLNKEDFFKRHQHLVLILTMLIESIKLMI